MLRITVITLFIAAIFSTPALGGMPSYAKSDFDPSALKIEEDDFLGATVPDIKMLDHEGNRITLSGLLGKPLVISLIYYTCVHSCRALNEGLSEALSKINLDLGRDFNVLTLSFDKMDLPGRARKFRENLRQKMESAGKLPGNFDDWVFATARYEDIERLTRAVGYRFFYSRQDKIFVHPNVYVFLSPKGTITRYLFGLFPTESDVKLALLEAAEGKIGKFPILHTALLACFQYDRTRGSYRISHLCLRRDGNLYGAHDRIDRNYILQTG